MEFLALICSLLGVIAMLIWLIIGWRAMRAHERIADATSEWAMLQRMERLANRSQTVQRQAPKDVKFKKNEAPTKPDETTGDSTAS